MESDAGFARAEAGRLTEHSEAETKMSTATTDNRTLAARMREYAERPDLFRADLLIRVGGQLVRFGDVQADFQRRDFAEFDKAITALAAGRLRHRPTYTDASEATPDADSQQGGDE